MEKLKEFFNANKKKCITAGVLIVAGAAYAFFGYEVNQDTVVNALCAFIGGC